MSSPVVLCRFVSCPVPYCRVVSCPVVSCLVVSHPVVSCPIVSCLVVSCCVLSCLVVSCPVLFCPVLSCLIILYYIYCSLNHVLSASMRHSISHLINSYSILLYCRISSSASIAMLRYHIQYFSCRNDLFSMSCSNQCFILFLS